MFDLNQFKSIEQSERQNIVAKKMVTELPAIIAKYKFKNFDLIAFEADLVGCFKQIKWLTLSSYPTQHNACPPTNFSVCVLG